QLFHPVGAGLLHLIGGDVAARDIALHFGVCVGAEWANDIELRGRVLIETAQPEIVPGVAEPFHAHCEFLADKVATRVITTWRVRPNDSARPEIAHEPHRGFELLGLAISND